MRTKRAKEKKRRPIYKGDMTNKTTRQNVLEFLREMYSMDYEQMVSDDEIASALGLTVEEIRGNLKYLEEKNLIDASTPDISGKWDCRINANGLDDLDRMEQEVQKSTTEQDVKLSKIEKEITDEKLEAERRKAVVETKVYGAAIEIITILRQELKRRDENKAISELKTRLSQIEQILSKGNTSNSRRR